MWWERASRLGNKKKRLPFVLSLPPSFPSLSLALSYVSSSPSDSGRRRWRVLPLYMRDRQNSHIAVEWG